MDAVLSRELLEKYRTSFNSDPKNILAQNVCTKYDPFEVCLSRRRLQESQHVFTYKIETEGKPITNQKSSGRCWLFAALNVMRVPFMKAFNLDEFEFSQGHLFFWDKIERCNFFLNTFAAAVRRKEQIEGRLITFLLKDLIGDGGQWDMLANVINKYGVMPKCKFPESFSCDSSLKMNQILRSKLREYAREINELVCRDGSDADVQSLIQQQMSTIFRIVGICLGIPDETFTWTYYDKNKAFHSIGPITPKEFYDVHLRPLFDVNEKVCLVTDPRESNKYGRLYTVDCLGNMIDGRKCIYNNQPVELLIKLAADSIRNGEPVWFGCEVSKRFAAKQGLEDLEAQDFSVLFGTDIQTTMPKADRLLYSESAMTHAMAFTGVATDESGAVTKFRVENSWGDDRGDKGYLVMTTEWFKEFGFEVVVDKKFVPQDVLNVFDQDPIVLPAWDPMGTLAL
ncbi:hypothetical protein PPYR_03599 [Photinus pyralis]|uniref:Bleomycin hydrolase n=1 Tax=Photinus pyralis TaxID=7054 RepID=A0A1Y1KSS5_PHOPY|nr:bleomycin hydrolase [Photinus pyralis]KAB0791799.1 hypothetical protein PPYR_03599 [Photinus pyralis]